MTALARERLGDSGVHVRTVTAATALQNLLTDELRLLGPGHPNTHASRELLHAWQEEPSEE